MIIVPSILTIDPSLALEQIYEIERTGRYEKVHIDFIDGKFANNQTFRPGEIRLDNFKKLSFSAHLMIKYDKDLDLKGLWQDSAELAGFDRIIWHCEEGNLGGKGAIAVDLPTKVPGWFEDGMFEGKDYILLMSVKAGFGGQKFERSVIEKIKWFAELRKSAKANFKIGVDGGVEKELLSELERLGVDEVVVGVKRLLQW